MFLQGNRRHYGVGWVTLWSDLCSHSAEFQRLYTPTAFREERILWRAVIQLNVVRSIATILDAISSSSPYSSPRLHPRTDSHQQPIASSSTCYYNIPSPPTYPPPLPPNDPDIDNSDSEYTSLHYHHRNRRSPSPSHYYHTSPSSSFTLAHSSSSIPLSIPLEALRARLHAPLRHLEALLISKLVHQEDSSTTHFSASSPGALDLSEHASSSVSIPGDEHHQPSPTGSCFPHVLTNATNTNNNKELSIRIGPGWRGVLSNARVSPPLDTSTHTLPHSRTGSLDKTKTKDEAQEMMYSLRKDMIQLWHDPSVRDILRRRKIRLEESSGL
jgi:hypothetical protein